MRFRKCRTLRGGRVTVYPASTHDWLVEQSFPRLESALLGAIKSGSRSVDMAYKLIPVTLIESNAPKHAMTPKSKVDELLKQGKSQQDALHEAREWARDQAKAFVDANGEEAKRYMRESRTIRNKSDAYAKVYQAYKAFGRGAHTLMDNVSPAHHDFRFFAGLAGKLATAIHPIDAMDKAAVFGLENMEHKWEENHEPSVAELVKVKRALHNFYRNVFGQQALDEVK